MAQLFHDYFLYFIICAIALVVTYVIGRVLVSLVLRKTTMPDLLALVVGATVLALVNSVGYVHPTAPLFASGILLLGVVWLRVAGQNLGEKLTLIGAPQTRWWQLLLGFTVIFSVVFLRLYSISHYPWFNAERDHVFYGAVAELMNAVGAENPYLDRAGQEGLGMIPYHYGEIHLTGLFSKISGVLPVQVYHFITSTYLLFVLWIGALQFWRTVNKESSKHAWFVGLALILCASHPVLNSGPTWVNHIKFIPAILCCLFMLKGVIDRNWRVLLIAQMLLCTWNHGFAALILLAIPAELIAFRIFGWAKFTWKEAAQYGLVYLLFAAAYQGWVSQFMDVGGSPTNPALSTLMGFYEPDGDYVLALKNGLTYILQAFAMYPIFLALVLAGGWMFRKKLAPIKPFLFMLFGLLLVGAMVTTLFYFFVDVWQVFLGVWIIMLPVLVIYTIGNFLASGKKVMIVGLSILFVVFAAISNLSTGDVNGEELEGRMGRYSLAYLEEMQAHLSDFDGPGIRLLGAESYQNQYDINGLLHFEGYPLFFIKSGVELHSPLVWNVPRLESPGDIYNFNRDIIIQNSYAYQYMAKHGWDESQGEDLALLEQFVTDEKVAFVVAAPGQELPNFLEPRIKGQIADAKSGERIYFLTERP